MPYLVAAVVVLALLSGANLVFTFAVIRRLRAHGERIAELNPVDEPRIGSSLRSFRATTTDGEQVSESELAGRPALLGFFSPACPPCRLEVPRFAEFAEGFGDRGQVLAVIVDDTDEATVADEVAMLAGSGRVVLAKLGDPLPGALSVASYPTVVLLDEAGKVTATSTGVGGLPALQGVR